MKFNKNHNRLFAITVSKNYATELSIMLDHNAKYFDKWYIATQEDDVKTTEIIKSKNLPNVEIVYYPLVPGAVEKHHVKSPLQGAELHFCYPSWLGKNRTRGISLKVKRTLKLTFDKGAAIRSIQSHHLPKETPTENDLILLLDSDIVFPKNFQEILNSNTFEPDTLYGSKRKDFMFYSDFTKNVNAKPYNSFELAGYFQLYKYDPNKLCKRTHDAGWVDVEFKNQFQNQYTLNDLEVSHLGTSGINWTGKTNESFYIDDDINDLKKYAEELGIKVHVDDIEIIKEKIKSKLTGMQLSSLQFKHNFPTFVMPGFKKCGSSSLKINLMQHSMIDFGRCFDTELNYCANEEYHLSNWHHTHMWYLQHFPKEGTTWGDHCSSLFGRGWTTTIDRMKTTYMAKLFNGFLPRKFIVVLRNPVDRAISEYNHYMQEFPASYNYDWLVPGGTLCENVQAELNEISKCSNSSEHMIKHNEKFDGRLLINGYYYPVIKHFKSELGLDDKTLKVITLESLINNSEKVFREIFEFLEIPNEPINFKKYNSQSINEPIESETRNKMMKFFLPMNQQLFNLLGYEIKEWQQ